MPHGCYARAGKPVVGSGVGGKVLFPLSSWTGVPCLPQPGTQERSSRRPPIESPLGGVGCSVLGLIRSGQPAWVCGSRNQVPETARMGTRVEWPGRFAAVMLGGRVGTFCQLEAQFLSQTGWPLAETTCAPGLLPIPCRVKIGKTSRGPLKFQRMGCCGQPPLTSQVAIPHHFGPLLTQVVKGGVSALASPSQVRALRISGSLYKGPAWLDLQKGK